MSFGYTLDYVDCIEEAIRHGNRSAINKYLTVWLSTAIEEKNIEPQDFIEFIDSVFVQTVCEDAALMIENNITKLSGKYVKDKERLLLYGDAYTEAAIRFIDTSDRAKAYAAKVYDRWMKYEL